MYWSDTTFVIPDVSGPTETLYLMQYSTWGHHSLAFHKDGQLIEFTYGDWALFALDQRDLWTSVSHMVWPTQGALGRKAVPWQPGQPACPLFVDCQQVVPFEAPLQQAKALFEALETSFNEHQSQQVFHEEDAVYFVPYDVAYGVWNNCNHELAKWLEQLGGKVRGRVFWEPDFIKGMTPKLPSIP